MADTPPIPSFSFSPPIPGARDTVQFDATASSGTTNANGTPVPGAPVNIDTSGTATALYAAVDAHLTTTETALNPPAFPQVASSTTWTTTNAQAWTAGFLPLIFLKRYEKTTTSSWLTSATNWMTGGTSPLSGQTGLDVHDLGFMFRPFFESYRITGSTSHRDSALAAATTLNNRWNAVVGAFKSFNQTTWNTIIDSSMNMELLLWAATVDSANATTYRTRVVSHFNTILNDHVRADGSTVQEVDYDTTSGAVTAKVNVQGFSNSSTWARGQSWGIYGFTMAYRYLRTTSFTTAANQFLTTAVRLASYFVDNLPSDGLPRWDFGAPVTDTQKDSSAAAITASALVELASFDTSRPWKLYARALLARLSSSLYVATASESAAIIKHAVGNKPAGSSVDVGTIYTDTFYVEALDRYLASPSTSGTNALNDYWWKIGSTASLAGQTPTYAFNSSGVQSVTLTTTQTDGEQASTTRSLTVAGASLLGLNEQFGSDSGALHNTTGLTSVSGGVARMDLDAGSPTGGAQLTSGTLYVAQTTLPAGAVVNSIRITPTTGSSGTQHLWGMIAQASSLVKFADTDDDTTNLVANTPRDLTFFEPGEIWTLSTDTTVLVGVCCVASSMPSLPLAAATVAGGVSNTGLTIPASVFNGTAVATPTAGSIFDIQLRYTTPTGSAPTVTTGSATNITTTAATINGTVNPQGATTSYAFDWGTTTSYGTSTTTTSAGSGSAPVNVAANLSGLTARTTYHYRLRASSSSGSRNGADQTLVTTATAGTAVAFGSAGPYSQSLLTSDPTVTMPATIAATDQLGLVFVHERATPGGYLSTSRILTALGPGWALRFQARTNATTCLTYVFDKLDATGAEDGTVVTIPRFEIDGTTTVSESVGWGAIAFTFSNASTTGSDHIAWNASSGTTTTTAISAPAPTDVVPPAGSLVIAGIGLNSATTGTITSTGFTGISSGTASITSRLLHVAQNPLVTSEVADYAETLGIVRLWRLIGVAYVPGS